VTNVSLRPDFVKKKNIKELAFVNLRFQVLTAASMKMAVFWVAAPCILVEVYRRFRGACCLHHQGDSDHLYEYVCNSRFSLVEFLKNCQDF
jgi:hypothetical protein